MIRQITNPDTVQLVDPESGEAIIDKDTGKPAELPFHRFVTAVLNANDDVFKRNLETIELRRDIRQAARNRQAARESWDVSDEAHGLLCQCARNVDRLPWPTWFIEQLVDAGYFAAILDAPKASGAESKALGSGDEREQDGVNANGRGGGKRKSAGKGGSRKRT